MDSPGGGSRSASGDPPRFDPSPRAWLRAARAWDRFAYVIEVLPAAIAAGVGRLGLRTGDRVLDFGCADQPYRRLFGPGIDYVGADIAGNPLADLDVSASGTLPVPDGSFDAVISTQVLEHVLDPRAYVRECARVLRPGGRLLLSTHGTMVLHPDPIDLWRWTSSGLRHELESAGLHIVHFEGIVGLAATAIQLFQDATAGHLPRRLQRPYVWALQSLMAVFDRRHSDASRALNALVYLAVAERPMR